MLPEAVAGETEEEEAGGELRTPGSWLDASRERDCSGRKEAVAIGHAEGEGCSCEGRVRGNEKSRGVNPKRQKMNWNLLRKDRNGRSGEKASEGKGAHEMLMGRAGAGSPRAETFDEKDGRLNGRDP